jgi:hypothetical protein
VTQSSYSSSKVEVLATQADDTSTMQYTHVVLAFTAFILCEYETFWFIDSFNVLLIWILLISHKISIFKISKIFSVNMLSTGDRESYTWFRISIDLKKTLSLNGKLNFEFAKFQGINSPQPNFSSVKNGFYPQMHIFSISTWS